jgi:hypothetical protein
MIFAQLSGLIQVSILQVHFRTSPFHRSRARKYEPVENHWAYIARSPSLKRKRFDPIRL